MDTVSSPESTRNLRRAERRTSPGLAAYHWNGRHARQEGVRDISSTGVYLLTEERWPLFASVSLTLHRIGQPADSPDNSVTVEAKAVRWGEDGLGLAFVLPEGMDLRLWQSPLKDPEEQTEPEDIVREFRTADALVFLRQICPSGIHEATHLLREGLSNYRVESAVEIALQAEKLLAAEGQSPHHLDNPYLVLRILEDGSWADTALSRRLWAGLLASSCSSDAPSESNLVYVDLLSQLTATHIRLLVAACTKAPKMSTNSGQLAAQSLVCTPEKLINYAGIHDLIKIDRDLAHLADLGLLAPRYKPSYFSVLDDTAIRPTSLGLELYGRCNSRSGSPVSLNHFLASKAQSASESQISS